MRSSRTGAIGSASSNLAKKRYRERHRIENAFCRLKDFRRIATRVSDALRPFYSASGKSADLTET